MSPIPTVAQVRRHLHLTGRAGERLNRLRVATVPILHGVHLERLPTPWARTRAIEIARVLAIGLRHPTWVAVARSALLLHGLDIPDPAPDEYEGSICFSRPATASRGPLILRAVPVGRGRVIPAFAVSFTTARHARTPAEMRHGIRAQRVAHATVSCAFAHPGAHGFQLVCAGYRACLALRANDRPAPGRTEWLRRILLGGIATLPAGQRGICEAKRILAAADAGCESPGESRLLWILHRAGITGIETQHRVDVAGRTFFIDFVIPGLRLALEFDGRFKYGDDPDAIHRTIEEERRRERLLAGKGWTVVRFRWNDLASEEALVSEVRGIVAAHGGRIAA